METNEETYRNFQRRIDRLCSLIVASDCTEREIDIERLHLRVQAVRLFPGKMPLYDLIYESRPAGCVNSSALILNSSKKEKWDGTEAVPPINLKRRLGNPALSIRTGWQPVPFAGMSRTTRT